MRATLAINGLKTNYKDPGRLPDGAYNRRDLFVSNLVVLYPGVPITGRMVYNQDFTVG